MPSHSLERNVDGPHCLRRNLAASRYVQSQASLRLSWRYWLLDALERSPYVEFVQTHRQEAAAFGAAPSLHRRSLSSMEQPKMETSAQDQPAIHAGNRTPPTSISLSITLVMALACGVAAANIYLQPTDARNYRGRISRPSCYNRHGSDCHAIGLRRRSFASCAARRPHRQTSPYPDAIRCARIVACRCCRRAECLLSGRCVCTRRSDFERCTADRSFRR